MIYKDLESAVNGVIEEVSRCGSAFLDWGLASSADKNILSKELADEVRDVLTQKGYETYYQTMGYGSSRIPMGTPVVLRIRK